MARVPPETVEQTAALTQARPPTVGRTRLVCVDGPAGSGKTTLAGALERRFGRDRLSVATLHMDDFYEGWSGLRPEIETRIVAQVLKPLADEHPARWQRYDWIAEAFAEWRDLPPTDVLILEGCGSGALAYDPYRTVLVWVEADRDTRMQRGMDRDGPAMAAHWEAWMESEERHFAANRTRERADVVLRTG
jgi:uridine kinase